MIPIDDDTERGLRAGGAEEQCYCIERVAWLIYRVCALNPYFSSTYLLDPVMVAKAMRNSLSGRFRDRD